MSSLHENQQIKLSPEAEKYVYYRESNPDLIVMKGDCLEIMPLLPKVDLVVTDPPYGVNLDYGVYKDTEENWFKTMDALIPIIQQKSSMSILPSCQINRMGWIYKNHPPDWLICWFKGSPGHAGFIGFNDWEPHLVYGKNNTSMHDYFYAQPEPFKNGHPCPKPVRWATWQIERATKENQTVLDPFLGSGTTLVACKELNRNGIGIEINERYCAISKKRLQNTTKSLFYEHEKKQIHHQEEQNLFELPKTISAKLK